MKLTKDLRNKIEEESSSILIYNIGDIMKYEKIIIYILSICLIISLCGACVQTYRLGQVKHELGQVRMELQSARDRQSEITNIIKRDGDLLRESGDTIADIRSQISIIYRDYIEMENILYSSDSSGSR